MKRPTVGVMTLVDFKNFGNRLQNFAVHENLRRRGLAPTTVEVQQRPSRSLARAAYYASLKDARGGRVLRGRFYRSWQFTHTFVPYVSLNPLRGRPLGERFDLFAIGSDQVWNPNDRRLGGRADGVQCLTGVDAARKTLVAPSFGLAELPPDWSGRYATWLDSFDRLSSREVEGAELIRKLTGRPADVVIDPTMTIEVARWRDVANHRDQPTRPYLVQLLLGSVSLSRRRQIHDFAARHSLTVVDLGDEADSVGRRIGPQEFLSLIDGAHSVFTDSFHCSIFGFLFQRPLLIFEREGSGAAMSSRISSLVNSFDLRERVLSTSSEDLPDSFLDTADYDAGAAALARGRVTFGEYLDSEIARMLTTLDAP